MDSGDLDQGFFLYMMMWRHRAGAYIARQGSRETEAPCPGCTPSPRLPGRGSASRLACRYAPPVAP